MTKQWVADASPLILLEKIGQLPLLMTLCDELVVPSAVIGELERGGDELKWELFFGAFPKIEQLREPLRIHAGVGGWDLGAGESEVISLVSGVASCILR